MNHIIQTVIVQTVKLNPPVDLLGTTGWRPAAPSLANVEDKNEIEIRVPYITEYKGEITDLSPSPKTIAGVSVKTLRDSLSSLKIKNCWCFTAGNERPHTKTCENIRHIYEELSEYLSTDNNDSS